MKRTALKGICHDLAHHLDTLLFTGKLRHLAFPITTNILKQKHELDILCATFFKEHLPQTFDLERIKKIEVHIDPPITNHTIDVTIFIDDKKVDYTLRSINH